MDGPRKRTLTEERQEIASTTNQSALDTGAALELAISLRNVGARVRHSVSQGYRTPPSNSFVKAQSTGTIFRSMNDTLRLVHTDLSTASTQNLESSKKRSRSVEGDDYDGEEPEAQCPNQLSPHPQMQARTTKPLKFSKFVRTPSLPSRLSSVADSDPHITRTREEVIEEEDWSLNMSPAITEAMEF